ncbi:hypothetical protein OIY81_2998 [Cryptosporidium canis]|nr:hypothetical protein OIY81_2998 [Cryptosporidium canis]
MGEMISSRRGFCSLEDFKRICGGIYGFCQGLGGVEDSGFRLFSGSGLFVSSSLAQVSSERDLVESIRTVAEVLVWEDQNEEQGYFDSACEFGIFVSLVELVIRSDVNYAIRKQSLQTLSIILQNLRNINTLYYILSNNVISRLLNKTFRSGALQGSRSDLSEMYLSFTGLSKEEEEQDELLSYYITLLRTLALRLNNETLRLFLNETTEFPLWKNACMYINHRDAMVRNTSRNVLLNILRSGEKEIIDFIILEEIRQFHHQGNLEQVLRYIDIDPAKTQDLARSSREGSSFSLIQTLVSCLIKQIHQFGELTESPGFEWPEIEEYLGIITGDHQEPVSHDDLETTGLQEPLNVGPIGPTSPITLSYTEADSSEGYSSPIVNQLSPTFYDRLIKPLERQMELILDSLEFFHEFVVLEIPNISWLICNSILHQVFEMVLFQKITNEIVAINQGISKSTLQVKIHLFIIYRILLFLYGNNQNRVYDSLISSIWDKFLKLGNHQSLFGNIFSTLINYLEEDSEFVLMFGLLNLYSIWGKKHQEEVKNSPPSSHREEGQKTGPEALAEEAETSPTVSGMFRSFVSSFSSLFQHKDYQESLIEEICRLRSREGLSLVELEITCPPSPNLLQRPRFATQRPVEERRCRSVPRSWKHSQDEENHLLYESESCERMMKECIHQRILCLDSEKVIKQSEFQIKEEFQGFYSKLNCEILSQDLNSQGLECLLFLAQFLEKMVSISERSNYSTRMRPLCLFVVAFLTLGVIRDHETLRQSNHFQDFCSLLDPFIKYLRGITLRQIGDLLRRDLNTGGKYSIFDRLGNLNYMICEHLLEWKDEDKLLIQRMFERRETTTQMVQRVISNTCILPLVPEKTSPRHSKRYIWNLIDTYPILRWFPNSCNGRGNLEETGRSRSILVDKLRNNYNNLQILEVFCERIDKIRTSNPKVDTELEDSCEKKKSYNWSIYTRMKVCVESRPFRVSVIRAKKTGLGSRHVQCNVIFDLSRRSLVISSPVVRPDKRPIMLARFEMVRCKPVPIMTRSYKTAIRYLVALLVRYRKYELDEHVILDDFLYELPLREDLLNSPNISRGAIIQPRETQVDRRIYHLNNLLLPAYTRVGLERGRGELGVDLGFSDYALYMEFESKKRSQEFIRRLSELRRGEQTDQLFEEYSGMFR